MSRVNSERLLAVVELLAAFWQDFFGLEREEVIDSPRTDLIPWLAEQLEDDVVPLLLMAEELGKCCGIQAESIHSYLLEKGKLYASEKRRLPLGEFVIWLAERANLPEFSPVNIGEHPCAAAGYFIGLRDVARNLNPYAERFAPSTPILSTLQGEALRDYWRMLHVHLGARVPELHWPWEDFSEKLISKALIGGVVGLLGFLILKSPWAAVELLTAFLLLSIAQNLVRTGNPLPPGIVTFGDLSRALAEDRHSLAG